MSILANFSIYGFDIQVQGAFGDLLQDSLLQDFRYFRVPSLEKVDLIISQEPPWSEATKEGFWIGQTKMCQIRQVNWNHRVLSYTNLKIRVDLLDQGKTRLIKIYSANADLFSEIANIGILSACGEFLEARGIMRVHAFSCLQNQSAKTFWGQRGKGKSTLALAAYRRPDVAIFSDELTLIDLETEKILPFPIRITMTEDCRRLLDLAPSRTPNRKLLDQKHFFDLSEGNIASPQPVGLFYILKSFSQNKNSLRSSWLDRLVLLPQILLGLGLIQMVEYMIRPSNIGTLFSILKNRMKLYFLLIRKNPQTWRRTKDIGENLDFIFKEIGRSSPPDSVSAQEHA